jgi:hypothetical protein
MASRLITPALTGFWPRPAYAGSCSPVGLSGQYDPPQPGVPGREGDDAFDGASDEGVHYPADPFRVTLVVR